MSTCKSSQLVYHSDAIFHPQMMFPFEAKPIMLGLDSDGETIRRFHLADEVKDSYFVLCFFTMDFKADISEMLHLNAAVPDFEENNTKVFGITADSPYVTRHWTRKPVSRGGLGSPQGFPILSDKDLYLSNLMGVSRPSGLPCRSTFIVDWKGRVRYMMCHKSEMGRSVKDILRIARAFRYSDLTGHLTPANWQPGDQVIPTDWWKKVEFYRSKYTGWTAAGQSQDSEKSSESEVQEDESELFSEALKDMRGEIETSTSLEQSVAQKDSKDGIKTSTPLQQSESAVGTGSSKFSEISSIKSSKLSNNSKKSRPISL